MEPITNSRIQQFKNCRKAYYYRNVEHLVPRIERESLGLGSAVHKGLETGSLEEALRLFDNIFPSSQDAADKLEENKVVVQAMLEGYFELYGESFPGNFQREVIFEVPIVNPKTKAKSRSFVLSGKADGLWEDSWLVEYKTAGQVGESYIDRLKLDHQMTTYIYGLEKEKGIRIDGVIYRVLRKPSIRQKKNESINQYLDRLINDYKNRPEFYFFEEQLYRSRDDLEEYEAELWQITQDILKCRNEGLWYKNTSRCRDWGKCEYLPLCTKQIDAIDLYIKKEVNSELREDDLIAITN